MINDSLRYLEMAKTASEEVAALFEKLWKIKKEGKQNVCP